MDARAKARLALALTVPLSSLLGLARAMSRIGARTFGDVWSANLWGDLAFALGTVAAGALLVRLLASWLPKWGARGLALAGIASLSLHWAVYALSWSFTVLSFADRAGHPFLAPAFQWSAGDGNAAIFTWQWGWPGLLAMALAGPAVAHWILRQRQPAPAPPPAVAA